MIPRTIERALYAYLNGKETKIFFMWGSRRSGKTTLLKKIQKEFGYPYFNFDLLSDQEAFQPEKRILQMLAKEHSVILIDEVHSFPDATRALKILHDEFKQKLIVTGSSELRQKTGVFETLAGRFTEHHCLPLSIQEVMTYEQPKAYEQTSFLKENIERFQLFGAYPEIYTLVKEEEKYELLSNIVDTYVLKDIIGLYDLRNAKLAKDLLIKIALQIGQEVSVRELASSLGANAVTISNYIEIFIKNYILIPLPVFKTNMRRAVSRHRKLYFFDLGIRNALIKDFRPTYLRQDAGSVFENVVISEIVKHIKNHRRFVSLYFYREYSGREIDLIVEDYQKRYRCYEIKQHITGKKPEFPLPHTFEYITKETYVDRIEAI